MRRAATALAVVLTALLATACGSTTTTSVSPSPVRCEVSLTPPSGALPAGRGTGSFSIATEPECAWAASAEAGWITAVTPPSGLGSATVRFDVSPNAGPPRSGTITVEGQTVTINQRSGCEYAIQPTTRTLGAGAGTSTTSVSSTNGCAWTATSHVPWMAITSGASGTGNGIVRFSVDANTSPARTGTLTVAGRTLTVSQASGCNYTVQPGALSAGAAGGLATVAISAGAACAWTAQSDVPWMTVTAGAGAGNGEAAFTIARNEGPQRSGTITAAGRTITITQANGCHFMLSPASMTFLVFGGAGVVTVGTAPGCAWTAVSSASWIVIVQGESGVGSGDVTFIVAPSFARRSGTVSVGKRSVAVHQN